MLINTREELEKVKEECFSMVTNRSAASAAAAVAPVPGVDIGADVIMLMEMIPAINKKFGLSPEQIEGLDPQIKKMILVAVTSIGSELIAKQVTKQVIVSLLKTVGVRVATKQVAKYIPFVGTAIAATVSFTAMKYLGNTHVEDCFNVCERLLTRNTAKTVTSYPAVSVE